MTTQDALKASMTNELFTAVVENLAYGGNPVTIPDPQNPGARITITDGTPSSFSPDERWGVNTLYAYIPDKPNANNQKLAFLLRPGNREVDPGQVGIVVAAMRAQEAGLRSDSKNYTLDDVTPQTLPTNPSMPQKDQGRDS